MQCLVSYTRYTSLLTLDTAFPNQVLIYPIIYQNQAFKMYSYQVRFPSACLPLAFIIKPLYWLSNNKAGVYYKGRKPIASNQFLNLTTYMVPKSDKSHASSGKQSANRFNHLSYVHINEWEYTFQVTYILVDVQRFFT